MTSEANAFLLGSGGKSAKFDQPGAGISGTVVDMEVRDQTDLATGKILAWDNGETKKQLVVTLQTDEREPGDTEDDGIRKVYVKGSRKPESQSLHAAVAGAIRAAGAKNLEVGGTLSIVYIGDGVATTKGFNPPKQYQATYESPAAGFLAEKADTPPWETTTAKSADETPDAATVAALANLDPKALAALAAQLKP